MKKIVILCSGLILAACSTTNSIDISNANSYGLKCSKDAATAPDWDSCLENANQTCAAQKAINVQQHNPTGSGSADDGYFLSFQCG